MFATRILSMTSLFFIGKKKRRPLVKEEKYHLSLLK